MRIRIVSDGKRSGTQVTNADTGEDIGHHITAISWSIRADEKVAAVTMEWFGADLDIDLTGDTEPSPEIDFRTADTKASDA